MEAGATHGIAVAVGEEVAGDRHYYAAGLGLNLAGVEGRLNLRVPLLLRTKHKQVRRMEHGLELVQQAEACGHILPVRLLVHPALPDPLLLRAEKACCLGLSEPLQHWNSRQRTTAVDTQAG